jgi:predicted Zn-ribbon and HTH transcriptional regulator
MEKEYVLPILKCKRCGHTWIQRKQRKPGICPVCKRWNWDEDKA